MTKYGLRNKLTGLLARYSTVDRRDSSDCCDEEHILEARGGDADWLVDSPENTEHVRLHKTPWYNARYETPNHGAGWRPDEWEVARVEIRITITPVTVSIPTVKEYFEEKYSKKDPKHLVGIMQMLKEGKNLQYSWCELQMLWEEQKRKRRKK